MIKRKSIFSRLFLSYSLIIILSLLLFMSVFFYLFHLNYYHKYDQIFDHQYSQIKQLLDRQKTYNWSQEETAEILNYTLNQSGYHIYLVNTTGEVLFGPSEHHITEFLHLNEQILHEIKAGNKVSLGGFENGEMRYTVISLLHLNSEILELEKPMMVLHVYDINNDYKRIIWMIVLTFFISIIFAGIVLWFISKRFTHPLIEMSEIARQYAKGDFSKSVQYQYTDEIEQLAKSFTYMAGELKNLESKRRQFISNVSHELRSPLTSLKGFMIAFMDGTIPKHRQDYYLKLMKNEIERMIKLVNDTLDMNQLEEGHEKLVRTNYNLTDQINRTIHKLEPQCQEKQLHINFQTDQDYYVYADEARIEQVITNLLQNAIQFSHPDSTIDVALLMEGTLVKVLIRDYGIGIEEEQIPLIWERFYKADEARSSKTGAGLGLAIVKSILDLHESDIDVDSKPGEGTTFTFKLPLSKS